jgi:hypothetical protein
MKHGVSPLLMVAIGLLAGAAPADAPTAPLAPLGPVADWPDTTSPKPKPEEWDTAAAVLLERPNEGCTTSRVREWLRVSCRFGPKTLTGVRVLSGPTEGVELTDKKPAPGQPTVDQWHNRIAHGVNLTFAVRRGDRRLFEVVEMVPEGRYTLGEDAAAIISAVWLPGDAGPTIVVD